MVGRIKQDINILNVFDSEKRKEIFEVAKTPINFTNLKKAVNLSSASLEYHLKILKSLGLIKREIIRINEKQKIGQEVNIQSLDFNKIFLENSNRVYQRLIKDNKNILLKISLNGSTYEDLFDKQTVYEGIEKMLLLDNLVTAGILKEKFFLTKEGKELIK